MEKVFHVRAIPSWLFYLALVNWIFKIRLLYSPEVYPNVVWQSAHTVPGYRSCHVCHRTEPIRISVSSGLSWLIGRLTLKLTDSQPQYVSFATNIFTGLHSGCLLAVTAWFIYQVKYESFWAKWFRIAMAPVTICVVGVTTIAGTAFKYIWMTIKRPYKEYKQNMHLQRNVYW